MFNFPFMSSQTAPALKKEEQAEISVEQNKVAERAAVAQDPAQKSDAHDADRARSPQPQDENRAPGSGEQAQEESSPADTEVRHESPVAAETLNKSLPRLECDYDLNPTMLYEYLQLRNWDAALDRLKDHEKEARTWVSRKEKTGKLRWRLLPLHASVIFKAPENVVRGLLGAYPKGAECKDDQGMLPLHLAFRSGSSEEIVNLLLVAFPQSVNVRDRKGRIPLVLAQASTSPNRDAFMRALERGPSYYAVAAAATERATVTAEQQAMFDAKLSEIKQNHKAEITEIRTKSEQTQMDLEEKIRDLESELAKTQETSQVLVDHVNTLEAQLTSRSDTERFLATRIAALDTNLRLATKAKEDLEFTMRSENDALIDENRDLQEQLDTLQHEHDAKTKKLTETETALAMIAKNWELDRTERDARMQTLEKEWANTKASEAILEIHLKKRIETERSLATQVSTLANKLAESAENSNKSAESYKARVCTLEREREDLRFAVKTLTMKLHRVVRVLENTVKSQEAIANKAAQHDETLAEAKSQLVKLIADATAQEGQFEVARREREVLALALKRQEAQAGINAELHRSAIAAFASQNKHLENTQMERDELFKELKQHGQKIQFLVNANLSEIPTALPAEDEELIDTVVQRVLNTNSTEETDFDFFSAEVTESKSASVFGGPTIKEEAIKLEEEALLVEGETIRAVKEAAKVVEDSVKVDEETSRVVDEASKIFEAILEEQRREQEQRRERGLNKEKAAEKEEKSEALDTVVEDEEEKCWTNKDSATSDELAVGDLLTDDPTMTVEETIAAIKASATVEEDNDEVDTANNTEETVKASEASGEETSEALGEEDKGEDEAVETEADSSKVEEGTSEVDHEKVNVDDEALGDSTTEEKAADVEIAIPKEKQEPAETKDDIEESPIKEDVAQDNTEAVEEMAEAEESATKKDEVQEAPVEKEEVTESIISSIPQDMLTPNEDTVMMSEEEAAKIVEAILDEQRQAQEEKEAAEKAAAKEEAEVESKEDSEQPSIDRL